MFRLPNRRPDRIRRRRYGDLAHPERAQCVENAATTAAGRGGAAFAAGFDPRASGLGAEHFGDLGGEEPAVCRRAAWRNPSASRSAAGGDPDRDRSAPTSPGRSPGAIAPWVWPCSIRGLMQRPTMSTEA